MFFYSFQINDYSCKKEVNRLADTLNDDEIKMLYGLTLTSRGKDERNKLILRAIELNLEDGSVTGIS